MAYALMAAASGNGSANGPMCKHPVSRPHFIELKASGWKGPSGTRTAIGCSENERAFFEAMAKDSAARGDIIIHSLTLDSRPVAMTVNFRSGTWV